MSKHIWVLKEPAPADFLSKNSGYAQLILQLLWSRGVTGPEAIGAFLNADYDKSLHDPNLLLNITAAAKRVWRAIVEKEKILIYGDYDADGICSSVILSEFFQSLNYPFGIYMPDRQLEGHGLSVAAVESFIKDQIQLVIVLDCGTTDKDAITLAKKNGLDVIVVDHHQIVDEIPAATALINPHQPGDNYSFKGLCATGLTFKFLQVLISSHPPAHPPLDDWLDWSGGKEKWLLDLVALATVADMMPLIDENRVLVKFGLIVLAQTKRLGFKKLFEVARVKPTYDSDTMTTNLDTVILGFAFGPRINAASRMAHAALAYNLLMTKEETRATELALELEQNNRKRKEEIEKTTKELKAVLKDRSVEDFIIEGSAKWPITLLGLIAGRLKDEYSRPVMLFEKGSEKWRASLRSPDGFDLMAALSSINKELIQYGGHKAAAGCSFYKENLEAIVAGLKNYASQNLTAEMKQRELEIDTTISLREANLTTAELVEKLAPFGMLNPRPIFLIKDAILREYFLLGNSNRHAKLFLEERGGGYRTAALMFFHNGEVHNLQLGLGYDIVVEISVNEWNRRREPQVKILDIRQNDD